MRTLTIVWLILSFVFIMGYSQTLIIAEAAPALAAQSIPRDANGVPPFGLTRVNADIEIVQPEDIITVGNWLFFRQGAELWKSDGTVTGTVVVAQNMFPFGMQACNDQLYFRHANTLMGVDAGQGERPPYWIKDGIRGPWNPETVQCSSSRLFFVDSNAQYGQELWQTSGWAGGTSLVKDINPGRNGSGIEELFLFKDNVLFSAYDEQMGDALWRSDGTLTGTLSLSALPGPVTEYAATQQALFFKVGCCQLWRADDASNSAALVKDFSTEQLTEIFLHPTPDFVYITANQRPPSYVPVAKGELWRSDGTAQGTVKLKQLQHIARDYGTHIVGDRIIFPGAEPPDYYDSHWYVSDGTITGTSPFSLTYPVNFSPKVALPQFPNQIFVTAAYPQPLWRTDGTVEGTVELPAHMGAVGAVRQFGNLFAYTDEDRHGFGSRLGVSDGTPAGTRILFAFSPSGSFSKIQLKNVNDTLFVFVYAEQNSGLWAYHAPTDLQSSNVYLPVVSSQ